MTNNECGDENVIKRREVYLKYSVIVDECSEYGVGRVSL